MSGRLSSNKGKRLPQQVNSHDVERDNSFPAVSFLLSSEAPAYNLYERQRYDQNIQSQQDYDQQSQLGEYPYEQGGSSDLVSKCKRTISLLKMHQREPSYESISRALKSNGDSNVVLAQRENFVDENYTNANGISPALGTKEGAMGIVRGIDVLRLEYKVKELESIIAELTSVNSQLQKSIQSSNSRIVVLTKSLEAAEINLLEHSNKSSLLTTQLQRIQDDVLIREQQILSHSQSVAAENFERVKRTYEQQLEVRRVQAIQSTKLFKSTVADLQKELEKVSKKLEVSEKSNRSQEGVLQQKNKIIASMGVRKTGEYESILDEKNAQILNLQTALKEYKKTFKQEDRLVKDLSCRESNLQEKVTWLQEENQRLHFEIKKVMRMASTEVKNLLEEKRQKEASVKEKEQQYERFLQVQQRQVERFQRELRLALKQSKKVELIDRGVQNKKSDFRQNSNSGSCSTRQNTGTTNRAKRSQSSSSVPSKKIMHSMPSEGGEQYMAQYASSNLNGYAVSSLPDQVKGKRVQMNQNYVDQQKRVDGFTYPMNGEISYLLQDTQVEGEEYEEGQELHEVLEDQENQGTDANSEADQEEGQMFGDDKVIHDRIEFLQKQLILKQNENLSLQAQLFQESQNVYIDDQSDTTD